MCTCCLLVQTLQSPQPRSWVGEEHRYWTITHLLRLSLQSLEKECYYQCTSQRLSSYSIPTQQMWASPQESTLPAVSAEALLEHSFQFYQVNISNSLTLLFSSLVIPGYGLGSVLLTSCGGVILGIAGSNYTHNAMSCTFHHPHQQVSVPMTQFKDGGSRKLLSYTILN